MTDIRTNKTSFHFASPNVEHGSPAICYTHLVADQEDHKTICLMISGRR